MSSHGFARRQMKRYGWSEGKGLGRTETGMKDAIKVKLKNNMGGLGHDQGAEFAFHWWDHIYNKAANSFKVQENDEGALIEKCEGKKVTPVLISTKKQISSKFSDKSLLYGTFIKSGTYDSNSVKTSGSLTDNDSCCESSDSDDDEDEKALVNNNTLDKMFKKTGLTGHKAARHGFSLNGKLQRLQSQEDKLLPLSTEYTKLKESDDNEDTNIGNGGKKKKKKKKKKDDSHSDILENDAHSNTQDNVAQNDNNSNKDNENNTKKKKKKNDLHSNKLENDAHSNTQENVAQNDNNSNNDNENNTKKKKKKKMYLKNDVVGGNCLSHIGTCLGKLSNSLTDITVKLKRNRKHKLEDNIGLLDNQPKKKKSKKRTL